MSDGLEFTIDNRTVAEVTANIKKFDEKMRAGLLLITKQVAKNMQEWAKNNAKWTDQTGNARKGLTASAEWENYIELVVKMSHKVDYGIWLELAHEKKYSILQPAIEKYKNEFISEWEKIINGVNV